MQVFSEGFCLEWDEKLNHHFLFALEKKTSTKVKLLNSIWLWGFLPLCTLWKLLLTLVLHNRICRTT